MDIDRFDEFFQALRGYPPFPWQRRLVRQVDREGSWPPVLALPTGAGKTAVIDMALFLLARDAARPRRFPLRTFFVIDRRIVVDEAASWAAHVRDRLIEALAGPPGVLRRVAEGLARFTGQPLYVASLRGGMYRDHGWAASPAQPTVCVSTVDQVGSRLLFRGYGVSERQRALHAGLVGNDSLIVLDEAHLSRPFAQTMESIGLYRNKARGWGPQAPELPFHVTRMTATPGPGEVAFTIDEEDRQTPDLERRLAASKLARLVEVGGATGEELARGFSQTAAEEALRLLGDAGDPAVRVVGVVVNRVATARLTFDLLRRRQADGLDADVILLTGRTRPYDRDELLRKWFPFLEARKGRPAPPRPLLIVATQTIEVGANLSFDALVTEAAPLDALRQRFGRLDRLGERGLSRAVVLLRKAEDAKDDPVYGKAIATTWAWLKTQQTGKGKQKAVDFGINALKPPEEPGRVEPLCSPARYAPVLLPAHLDVGADQPRAGRRTRPGPIPARPRYGPRRRPGRLAGRPHTGDAGRCRGRPPSLHRHRHPRPSDHLGSPAVAGRRRAGLAGGPEIGGRLG
jgi:CRISPR-associated endonuclease/helicase Cas3